MLKPPGSRASGGSSTRYASSRRKTMESPTDQLRKIAKQHPSNKKCCDCQAKLPQCINLSVGAFICLTCAGLHREINSKIKSLGHSTFTDEEVEMMKQTNNEIVNSVWLARYNPQNERSRLNRQPEGNQNQEHLRTWIRRKYSDKRWYSGSGGGSSSGGARSAQQPQATVVQIPSSAPQTDLFANFDAPAPASTPSNQNGGWDAFGGSSQQQQAGNFANFDNATNKPSDPFAQPPQQQAQPPAQQPHQNFANFGAKDPFAQQPAQPQNQNNFGNFGGQPQQSPQNQNVANFGNQQQPPQQQQPQQNFANFGNQHQPPQPQNFANFGNQPPQQPGFANFNQQPSPQPTPQPPAQPVAQPVGGFANLNQQQMPQQQMNNSSGFGNFNQQAPMQQPQQPVAQANGGFAANFNQQSPQSMQPVQQGGAFGGQIQNPAEKPPAALMPSENRQSSFSGTPPQASMGGSDGPPQQPPLQQQPPVPPQPTSTMMTPKEDPMDAFAHLSVGGSNNTESENRSSPAAVAAGGPTLSINEAITKPEVAALPTNVYEEKQVVCYKSNGKRCKAQIIKKHLDDELQPYYTIVLPFGKEKQTDNAHLELLDPAFENIESKLLSLSSAQLKQVESFLFNMPSVSSSLGMGSAAPKMAAPVTETVNAKPPSLNGGMMSPPTNGVSPNTLSIPSPVPDAGARSSVPNMGGIPAPNLGGPNGVPAQNPNTQMMMQQPQMTGQQLPQMNGQASGQPQMMMMQQQPMPGQVAQMQMPHQQGMQNMQGQAGGQQNMPQMQMQGQQPPQMQGQIGMQPQMMMQQQPIQGQPPAQMGQAAAPQGNPFDMY